MAPERASSTTVDVRTDLYSVGVVLYEMLTGQVPYDGVSPVDVLRKHIHEPLPRPRTINPQLPPVVEPVLQRALAKKPADRYQSADEMARDVQRLIGQIERLAAERRLREMLQQPATTPNPSTTVADSPDAWRRRAGMPRLARGDPYETREFTPYALPTIPGAAEPTSMAPGRPWMPIAVVALVLLVGLGGLALVRTANSRPGANEAAAVATTVPASATAVSIGVIAPTAAAPVPTATPVPTLAIVATPVPPAATPEAPAPTIPPPTPQPAPPVVAQTTPLVAHSGATTTMRFEDTDWLGGYRRAGGQTYGGRTATWVYGTTTEYNTMRTAFDLPAQPAGTASLTVEGMDSEGRAKTPIRITVNGSEIYNDLNPLPDDDQPLETGTWASYTWQFDAVLLRPGRNEIRISNLAQGAFSRPPFFMLDYAELAFSR
jgi:serine/threonine-protein kinase